MPRIQSLSPSPLCMEDVQQAIENVERVSTGQSLNLLAVEWDDIWPNALAVWWREDKIEMTETVGVLCPYHLKDGKLVGKIEEHVLPLEASGTNSQPKRHCKEDQQLLYHIVFHSENGYPNLTNLGSEFNITNNRFQVVGLSIPEFANSEVKDFHVAAPEPKNSGPRRTDFSRNVTNEPVDKYGNSRLAIASSRGNITGMKAHLKNGADPNTQNKDGMSPLMHAAMNGIFDAVLLLLRHGASKKLRNKDSVTAKEMLEEEDLTVDSVLVKQKAKIIVLLGSKDFLPRPKVDQSFVNIGLLETSHDSTSRTITALVPIGTYNFESGKYKTLAVLDCGSPHGIVSAVSGFNGRVKGPPHILNSEVWMTKAMEVAREIGHELEPNNFDNSFSRNNLQGTVSASHAEMQLLAYLFLKQPRHPRRTIQQVTIAVDHPKMICNGCLSFKEVIEKVIGIEINFIISNRYQNLSTKKFYTNKFERRASQRIAEQYQHPFMRTDENENEYEGHLEVDTDSESYPQTPKQRRSPRRTVQAIPTPPSSAESENSYIRQSLLDPESPSVTRSEKRRDHEGNDPILMSEESPRKKTRYNFDNLPSFSVEYSPISHLRNKSPAQPLTGTHVRVTQSIPARILTRSRFASIPGNSLGTPIEIASDSDE